MASWTGQQAAWNGLKNSLGAWVDWVVERKSVFIDLTPEAQKTWLESGKDPIIAVAYWLYKNHLRPMFEKTPDSTTVDNPLDSSPSPQGGGNGNS